MRRLPRLAVAALLPALAAAGAVAAQDDPHAGCVLQYRGDAAGAERELAEARRLWREADPDLAELRLMEATAAPAP